MSELQYGFREARMSRWRLLIGASSAAILAAMAGAEAGEAGHPSVWVEVGGQLERVDGGQERFDPPFLSQLDTNTFTSPLAIQKPPRYATGFEGSLTFQPRDSEMIFSLSMRYGRSNGNKKVHQLSAPAAGKFIARVPTISYYVSRVVTADAQRYADTTVKNHDTHTVVDFQVGRDVGLGLFGAHASSVVSAGVRFAQFSSRSAVTIGADPDFAFSNKYATQFASFTGYFKVPLDHWHLNRSDAEVERSFHGIGPSIAWQESVPVAGNADRAELSLNWGANIALLFGRQKAAAHHETDSSYQHKISAFATKPVATPGPHLSYNAARTRSVTVPNVGGYLGFSLRFPNAKINFGYRADIFVGAIDGGIDARHTYDRAFYGPFATVSIGLGG